MKWYLTTLLFVLAPLILCGLALYWFLSAGMAQDRYFALWIIGGILAFAYLRYGPRRW